MTTFRFDFHHIRAETVIFMCFCPKDGEVYDLIPAKNNGEMKMKDKSANEQKNKHTSLIDKWILCSEIPSNDEFDDILQSNDSTSYFFDAIDKVDKQDSVKLFRMMKMMEDIIDRKIERIKQEIDIRKGFIQTIVSVK